MANGDTFWQDRRVCVTGGAGFLGRVVCRLLRERGCRELFVPRSADYDLTGAADVARMYDDAAPDVVIHLAAQVGGIGANRLRPGRFFYANLSMGMHLIEQARIRGLEKFVQIGTVCSYPKYCKSPFHEDDLWKGYPEQTNAPYGVAKKSLLVMLQAYRAEYGLNGVFLVPVNLYGPGDNFDPKTSHVIPALIRKFHEAKSQGRDEVTCWGTGFPTREFLHVDDAADAIVAAAEHYNSPEPLNIGTGHEITIAELAALIAELVGYHGRIIWDPALPDGQPCRRLDVSRIQTALDWHARTELPVGLQETVAWWTAQQAVTHCVGAVGIPTAL